MRKVGKSKDSSIPTTIGVQEAHQQWWLDISPDPRFNPLVGADLARDALAVVAAARRALRIENAATARIEVAPGAAIASGDDRVAGRSSWAGCRISTAATLATTGPQRLFACVSAADGVGQG